MPLVTYHNVTTHLSHSQWRIHGVGRRPPPIDLTNWSRIPFLMPFWTAPPRPHPLGAFGASTVRPPHYKILDPPLVTVTYKTSSSSSSCTIHPNLILSTTTNLIHMVKKYNSEWHMVHKVEEFKHETNGGIKMKKKTKWLSSERSWTANQIHTYIHTSYLKWHKF